MLLLSGTYEDLPALVHERFDGRADGVALPAVALLQDDATATKAVAALRS